MIIYATHNYPSAITRGKQIAERLGCSLNAPLQSIQEGEVLVFVKGFCFEPVSLIKSKNCKVFLDIVDSDIMLPDLFNNPTIGVIAISENAKRYIKARLPFTNSIVTIDEHHCNFENTKRTRKEVTRVGYVGSKYRFNFSPEMVKQELAAEGFEFVTLFCEDLSLTREDICEFYKTIDIQLCMAVSGIITNMPPELKNPLKLSNAGSFGIPTVGFPEQCWETEEGSFLNAYNMEDIVDACKTLRERPLFYESCSNAGIRLAERYYIDNVISKYKELGK